MSGRARARRSTCLALVALWPALLTAQSSSRMTGWAAATGTVLRARTTVPGSAAILHGTLVGVEGRLFAGPVTVRLAYAEGSAATGPIRRDHVDGLLLVGVRPLTGLTVAAGPRATAYATDTTSERWLRWQLRGRYESPVVERLVNVYGELWVAVAGSAGSAGPFGRGRGGGAGLEVRLPGAPLIARLGYEIDDSRLKGGGRRERSEGLVVGIGVGR